MSVNIDNLNFVREAMQVQVRDGDEKESNIIIMFILRRHKFSIT